MAKHDNNNQSGQVRASASPTPRTSNISASSMPSASLSSFASSALPTPIRNKPSNPLYLAAQKLTPNMAELSKMPGYDATKFFPAHSKSNNGFKSIHNGKLDENGKDISRVQPLPTAEIVVRTISNSGASSTHSNSPSTDDSSAFINRIDKSKKHLIVDATGVVRNLAQFTRIQLANSKSRLVRKDIYKSEYNFIEHFAQMIPAEKATFFEENSVDVSCTEEMIKTQMSK